MRLIKNNKKAIDGVFNNKTKVNRKILLSNYNEYQKKSLIQLLEDEIFVGILVKCNTAEEIKYLFNAKGCEISDEHLNKIKECLSEITKKLQPLNKEELQELNNQIQTLSDNELEQLSASGMTKTKIEATKGALTSGVIGLIGGIISGSLDASIEIKDAKTTRQKVKAIGRVFLKAITGFTAGAAIGAVGGAVSGFLDSYFAEKE